MSDAIVGNLTEPNFTWEIRNYNTITADQGKFVYSPTFCTNYLCDDPANKILNLHWRLRLCPIGGCKNYATVYLENLDPFEISTEFSVGIKDELNNRFFFKENMKRNFSEKKFWAVAESESAIRLFPVDEYLLNKTFTIQCLIYSTSVKGYGQKLDEKKDNSEALLNHFDMLFNTGQYSDLTIKVGNQELRVHKNIVTSLSPVFQAMFQNQMKEHNENVVDIVDIEFNIVKEMLRYMYKNKVNRLESIASDLLIAADKYCVEGLKRLCEQSLCKELNEQNALQYLELAMRYNITKLKRSALKLISKRLTSFKSNKEFKEMSSECKSELLDYIAEMIGDINI